ncbi:MAG TPA: bifunctional pyr operon transcriptional regulator/uracil phosphoribosyltransferase PyrR [bacterium]|nr:bifunctional pyr operon transcriptional regulator/uracil phosphoribosyltransferase PyrR [bacterium]
MKIKSEIMDAAAIKRTLLRLTHEILEKNRGAENLIVVGIRTRGDVLAYRIIQHIAEIEKKEVTLGVLDITLYRDDFERLYEMPEVRDSDIPFDITGRHVILVDDVLFTGRTVRAALDALMDLGRPARIQLAVLIDRGHRELPVKADYVGKNVPTALEEQIRVELEEIDGADRVCVVQR